MRSVVRAIPRQDHVIELEFDSGEVKLLDLTPYLWGSLCEPLAQETLFRLVAVEASFGGGVTKRRGHTVRRMLRMHGRPFMTA